MTNAIASRRKPAARNAHLYVPYNVFANDDANETEASPNNTKMSGERQQREAARTGIAESLNKSLGFIVVS